MAAPVGPKKVKNLIRQSGHRALIALRGLGIQSEIPEPALSREGACDMVKNPIR